MQKEIWKTIPNYPNYLISSNGIIKNKRTNLILKPNKSQHKYYRIVIYNINGRKRFYVHVLMAITFLNHTPIGRSIVVDHINNDKLDNRLDNLQIITQRQNVARGALNKSSKYTGVSRSSDKQKWRATCWLNNKKIYLGSFNNEKIAHAVYLSKIESL